MDSTIIDVPSTPPLRPEDDRHQFFYLAYRRR